MTNNGNNLDWGEERRNKLNTFAHDQAATLRVARRVLKLSGPQGAYVDSVAGHQIEPGPSLSIRPNQHLQPLQISRHFHLQKEQFHDDETIRTLVESSAADIQLAEEAVVLLGNEAGTFLDRLNISLDNPAELKQQTGLFDNKQPEVKKPILDSIQEAIAQLQQRGQIGDYCAIVSPALYLEAYTRRQVPGDEPIREIKARLRENGFLYSEAAEGKRGVVFSLARNAINLAVPMDAYVERVPDD